MKINHKDHFVPIVFFIIGVVTYIYKDSFDIIGGVNTYKLFISVVVVMFFISLLNAIGLIGNRPCEEDYYPFYGNEFVEDTDFFNTDITIHNGEMK